MGKYENRHETLIQQRIQKYLKEELGAYEFKVHGDVYMRAGIPDIIACVNGYFIGIEVKDKGNKPSLIQLAHGRQIEKAKGIFIVAYSVDDVKNKLLELKII